MSKDVMGFDVSNVPTADLMEFAAKLLRLDALTLRAVYGQVGKPTAQVDNNDTIADLLQERAKSVRAIETLALEALFVKHGVMQ
jgi:hypothetical protein